MIDRIVILTKARFPRGQTCVPSRSLQHRAQQPDATQTLSNPEPVRGALDVQDERALADAQRLRRDGGRLDAPRRRSDATSAYLLPSLPSFPTGPSFTRDYSTPTTTLPIQPDCFSFQRFKFSLQKITRFVNN